MRDDSVVEQIKDRLDIVDVIGEYVHLKPAGANFKALSPFRAEKTPSFIVSPDKQIFKDFGGDKAGDIFSFVMEMEGLSFREALEMLASKAGVELSRQKYDGVTQKYVQEVRSQKEELYRILKAATFFWQKVLWESKAGAKPREYLAQRGITKETLQEFGVGFAPNTYQGLTAVLVKKGARPEMLAKSGLGLLSDKGVGVYDRFRGRIMIPIKDVMGRTVGFTGRVLPEFDDGKMGKYVNTPETEIFHKSKVLFGLDVAKTAIKQKDEVILVEGNLDVLMSHQAGVKQAVAVSGTALTQEHLKILRRYTQSIALCFDNDEAGLQAAIRSAKMIFEQGLFPKVIEVVGGKDPADMVFEDPKKWEDAVAKKSDFLEFYVRYLETSLASKREDPNIKKIVVQNVAEFFGYIQNPITRSHYVKKISALLYIDEKVVYDYINKIISADQSVKNERVSKSVRTDNISNNASKSAEIKLQEIILGFSLSFPNRQDIDLISEKLFSDKLLAKLFSVFKQSFVVENKFDLQKMEQSLAEVEVARLKEILLEAERAIDLNQLSEHDIRKTIKNTVTMLQKSRLRHIMTNLKAQLGEAQRKGEHEKVDELMGKLSKLSKLKNELQTS